MGRSGQHHQLPPSNKQLGLPGANSGVGEGDLKLQPSGGLNFSIAPRSHPSAKGDSGGAPPAIERQGNETYRQTERPNFSTSRVHILARSLRRTCPPLNQFPLSRANQE